MPKRTPEQQRTAMGYLEDARGVAARLERGAIGTTQADSELLSLNRAGEVIGYWVGIRNSPGTTDQWEAHARNLSDWQDADG